MLESWLRRAGAKAEFLPGAELSHLLSNRRITMRETICRRCGKEMKMMTESELEAARQESLDLDGDEET
jgi:hypothetical protein